MKTVIAFILLAFLTHSDSYINDCKALKKEIEQKDELGSYYEPVVIKNLFYEPEDAGLEVYAYLDDGNLVLAYISITGVDGSSTQKLYYKNNVVFCAISSESEFDRTKFDIATVIEESEIYYLDGEPHYGETNGKEMPQEDLELDGATFRLYAYAILGYVNANK